MRARGGVHRPRAGEPPPLRGAARVLSSTARPTRRPGSGSATPGWAMINPVREYRAGKLTLFAPAASPARRLGRRQPRPARSQASSSAATDCPPPRLRAAGDRGAPLNLVQKVGEEILAEEDGRLLRHPEPTASTSPAAARRTPAAADRA